MDTLKKWICQLMKTANAPDVKKILLYSTIIMFVFIGGFLIWALFAPLETGAIAPGSVVVAGYRRTIQHLEGGIVKKLCVVDGSEVKKSEILLTLDNTQAQAGVQINQSELWELASIEARIHAELDNADKITFPLKVATEKSQVAINIISLQQALFITNQQTFNRSVAIYNDEIQQLKEEINGTNAQINSIKDQLGYIHKELTDVKILAAKKLIKQSRLLALQREEASLTGHLGELTAKIAELQQKIGEISLHIIDLTDKRRKELLGELRETQRKLNEITERQKANEDILARTEIRSPIDGTVFNLKVHTIGGVIRPGEAIMEIVPQHEILMIEARLSPMDIDVVHVGLVAKVIFTGLSQRNNPKLLGKVTQISADAFSDPQTNRSYYIVKVMIPGKELKKVNLQTLYPGMPAEVMIVAQKATPWEYLTTPIIRSFNRAFREQSL
jgi:HlyD family type I secretion membrane fusion protein